MRSFPPLLLVGCGKMGSALASRWIRQGILHYRQLTIVTPQGNKGLPKELEHAECYKTLKSVPRHYHPGIIVFAVKPQTMPEVVPDYAKRFGKHHPLLLSIAAGSKVSYFAEYFGDHASIIRAMPNTPALIGKGMTVAYANHYVGEGGKQQAADLLRSVGELLWVDEESWMDAATAISGTGPAYLFYFIDSLAKAGEALGLPADVSRYLSLLTARGAAELALLSGLPLSTLREQVTSKGGTTQAALEVLMHAKTGLAPLMLKSVKAAHKRSRELSKH